MTAWKDSRAGTNDADEWYANIEEAQHPLWANFLDVRSQAKRGTRKTGAYLAVGAVLLFAASAFGTDLAIKAFLPSPAVQKAVPSSQVPSDDASQRNSTPADASNERVDGRIETDAGDRSYKPSYEVATFGGLTVDSTCTQYNEASFHDRIDLVADLIDGTSMATGRNYRSQSANIQSCVAATLEAPCASAQLSIRDAMALCLMMLFPR